MFTAVTFLYTVLNIICVSLNLKQSQAEVTAKKVKTKQSIKFYILSFKTIILMIRKAVSD